MRRRGQIIDDPARADEVIAEVAGKTIRRAALVDAMNARPGRTAEDVAEELVNLVLLAGDGRAKGFTAPEGVDADDDLAYGEAYARATFTVATVPPEALGRWFSERRSAARLVVADEATANRLADSFRSAPTGTPREAVRAFSRLIREHSVERSAIAPRRALFDADGLGETGDPVVHPAIAKAAFSLAENGQISAPIRLAEGRWAVVQRVAVRPAVDPDQVPPQVRERAIEGLKAHAASQAMKARAAELRAGAEITVNETALTGLRPAVGRRGGPGGPGFVDTRRVRRDRIIGRETRTRLKELLPDNPADGAAQLSPEEVMEKMKPRQGEE